MSSACLIAAAIASVSCGLTISAPSAPPPRRRIAIGSARRGLRILRGDVFLGDEVHAVAQRRHQADSRGSGRARPARVRIGTVDVADRRPGRLAEAAVDLADQRFTDLPFDVGVFGNVGAALRGDLQIGDLAAPFRVVVEETGRTR